MKKELKNKLECVIARIMFLQNYCKPTPENAREMDVLLDIKEEIEHYLSKPELIYE